MTEHIKNISEFDKTYNISYISPKEKEPDNKMILKHYLSSVVLYGITVLIYIINPYFKNCFNLQNYDINLVFFILYIYFAYVLVAPIIFFGLKPKSVIVSNNYVLVKYLIKLITAPYRFIVTDRNQVLEEINKFKPTYKEGQAICLYLIRFYFIPTMISAAIFNFKNADTLIKEVNLLHSTITANPSKYLQYSQKQLFNLYRNYVYLISISTILFINFLIMTFSYFWDLFNDKVKTVDTTPAGIILCLVCYSPFFIIFKYFFNTYSLDYLKLLKVSPENIVLWVFYIISLLFTIIFLISTCSLFTKSSNLMNKGIITRFPYNIIRHPYYASATGFIWTLTLLIIIESIIGTLILSQVPQFLFVTGSIIFAIVFTIIAIFRALTEERHLLKCPEYQKYCEQTKYRFIPFVW